MYSLCSTSNRTTTRLDERQCKIKSILENLASSESTRFAMLLDESYDPEDLAEHGIHALQNKDEKRFNLICSSNKELHKEKQFNFYIVHLTLDVVKWDTEQHRHELENTNWYVSLSGEENFWKETSRTLAVEKLFDVNGATFLENKNIDIDFFTNIFDADATSLDVDLKNEADFFRADNTDHLCENGRFEVTYHKYMLAFWPRKQESGFETIINPKLESLDSLLRKSSSKANQTHKNRKQMK